MDSNISTYTKSEPRLLGIGITLKYGTRKFYPNIKSLKTI